MKYISTRGILSLLLLLLASNVFSQNVGDYRSNANNVNWSELSTWQVYNGGWAPPTAGEGYPGQFAGTGDVEIRDNHRITLDVTPDESLGSLTFNGGGNDSYITFSGTHSLIVSGQTYILGNRNGDEKGILVNEGTFTTGSLVLNNSRNAANRDTYIRITTGKLNVLGDVTMNQTVTSTYIYIGDDEGSVNIGGSISEGGFSGNSTGGGSPASGTVVFNGTGVDQIIGSTYNFYNLDFIGSAKKILAADNNVINTGTVTSNLYCEDFTIGGAGSFTVSDGATLGIGSADGITASAALGNIQNTGVRTFSTSGNYIYNGVVAQVTGDGLSGASELHVETTQGLTLTNSLLVGSNLNLSGSNLILGDNNLSLLDGASISGSFDGDHMVLCNGNGALIKQCVDASDFNMTYPVGTYDVAGDVYEYSPMIISNASGTVTGTAEVSVKVTDTNAPNASAIDLLRYWETEASNLTAISADVSFHYLESDVAGTEANYEFKYTPSILTAVWTDPANASIDTGTNTLSSTGSNTLQGVWSAKEPVTAWYTLKSGNWNDPTVWTTDPSGALLQGDPNYYPQQATDNVVILSSRDITMVDVNDAGLNVDNINCNYLTIDGTLDLGTSSGHSFNKIFGGGRVFMQADNFPNGDATHFVTQNQGEGTVIYQGGGYTIGTERSFYDVEVELSATDEIITLLNNLTVNNNLTIKQGQLKINDDTSTSVLTVNVSGDTNILTDGAMTVGQGNTVGSGALPSGAGQYHNVYHQLVLQGNLINRGTIRFTNETAPRYNALSTVGGVTLRFEGATNNNMSLYGTTDLYNLVVDKGVDKTYILEVYADDTAFFRLFGANYASRVTSSPYSSENPENRKSLWVHNGTLKLTGSIHIPTLTEGGNDFMIGQNARLWLAGANVTVYATATSTSQIPGFESSANGVAGSSGNQGFAIAGALKVEDGVFGTRNSSGLIYWPSSNSVVEVNGGTVNICQFRSTGGASGRASYIQTGGQMVVRGNETESGEVSSGAPLFGLTTVDDVFTMSGGEILIQDDSGDTYDVYIPSSTDNANVTGGTIRFYETGDKTYDMFMTPPIFNFTIDHANTGNNQTVILHQPLTVLNDLIINQSGYLNNNREDVTIGRNFTISADAYWPNTSSNIGYRGNNNTTTFNGSEDAVFYIGHPYLDDWEQELSNVTISKPVGKRLLIDSDEEKSGSYIEANGAAEYFARILNVGGDLRVESGILDQGEHAIRMYGSLFVGESAECGIYEAGVTHKDALVMIKDVGTITTEAGAILGNIKMNPNPQSRIFDLTSDVVIKRISYHHGRMNLGAYNLKVDYLHEGGTLTPYDVSSGSAANEMFITDGNASDAGLSLLIHGDGTYAFPLGVTGKYTPAELTVTNHTANGYVTIRPVDAELTTTNLTGGNILDYYWRVGHSDFTTLPTVQYQFTFDDADDLASDKANFYAGKVLDETPYTRLYEALQSNVNTSNNTITFNDSQTTSDDESGNPTVISNTGTGFMLENANYTAGVFSRFEGAVKVFYTRRDGDANGINWSNTSTWTYGENASYGQHDSRQAQADAVPGPGDVAVIGWVPWDDQASLSAYYGMPHGVDANGTITCAEIVFNQMTDAGGNPVPRAYRYNFQFRPTICINNGNSLTADMVRGEGMFWNRQSDPDMSTMDLGEFAANDSSYVLYEITSSTLNNTPDVFPNLLVASSGWGGSNFTFTFTKDIVTNGNFEILGDGNVQLNDGATGDITIGRDLYMFMRNTGGGALLFYQNTGTARTVSVGRDIIMSNTGNRIYVSGTGGSSLDHRLYVNRDIIQTESGAGIDLWTSNTAEHVTLYLEGDEDMTFDVGAASAIPDLYRVVVNKGVDQSVTANFISDFNLFGETDDDPKAIELQNGTLIIDNEDIDVDLTTNNEHFQIPSTSALILKNGTLNASGGSGIELDGLLQMDGGTLNMHGGDNPIVYSASGNAIINVNDGSLIVGGQIRRGTVSDVGVLSYTQTGGSVRVGTSNASIGNRGVFEILGTGSQFTHSGGSLSIENGQSSSSVAALLLEPENSDVGNTSEIYIGGASTNAGQTIGINSSIALNTLIVDNSSSNNPIAQQVVRSLTLNKDLQIATNAQYDAAALDLYIGGDLRATGSFIPNGNSTYFNGATTQTIYGDVNFYNLEKSGTQELVLDATGANLDIDNNFVFSGGTLTSNSNIVAVQRNVTFDGTQVVSGGNGILLNGTLSQTLLGSGTFDVLTINNSAGVDVPLGNQLTVNTSLRLENGVFNIDKNLLILNSGSSIEAVNPFSSANMIQTNISFTDNGVRKYFNTTPKTFIYPMGSGGKYTPVSIRIDSNTSSTGYITVKAADEYHPSVIDPTNVLDYHWILKSEEITGFTGEIRMKYDPNDVNVTGTNTIDDYISARLLADGSGEWNKPFGIIDQGSKELVYDYITAITSAEITGDYTAGLDPAIPDQVPTYISIIDGLWTDASTWDTYPTPGEGVPAGGPRGAIVIVDTGTNVTVSTDAISSYQTTIEGTLSIGTTAAHRLGDVGGTGTLAAETGVMPAGVYDSFVSSSGGTLEYAGSTNYSILGDLTSVNNLSFTGSNQRRLPNHNLTIQGNLYINGASVVNDNDKNIILKQDFTFDGGSFDSGDNGARTIFSGTTLQTINGGANLTGTNGVDYFEIANVNGVTIEVDVDVKNYLNLNNGVIFNTLGNNFVVNSNLGAAVIGGGASSYVQGPLTKLVNNGDSFSFPVGDADRLGDLLISNTITSGADYWTAEYFNHSAGNDSKDPNSVAGDLEFVNQNEYWRIQGPTSSQAEVTLRWDDISGVTPDANFRVVEWQSTLDWNEVAIDAPSGDNTAGTVNTANRIAFNEFASEGNYFTFGSMLIPAYTWLGGTSDWFLTTNWFGGAVPSAGTDITISDTGVAPVVNNTTAASVNNLTIEHTGGLTLEAGSQMTVNGDLVTNDLLYINNTADEPVSLIVLGTVTGNVSTSWAYDELYWYFIGHSISNPQMQTYRDMLTSTPGQKFALYDYKVGGSLVNLASGSNEFAVNDEIRGYQLKVLLPQSLTHTGTLNNAATYSRVTQDGWQIMANPYPSYYKIPQATVGTGDFAHSTGTIYVSVSPTNQTKTFQTYNIASGTSSPAGFKGILAPSQGFYVKTADTSTPGSDQLFMRATNRFHDVNKVSLKSGTSETDILRIKLSNDFGVEDEAVVALREDGDMAMSRMDSEQRFYTGTDISYIYSMVEADKVVINVLPSEMYGEKVVLGVQLKAGHHTIRIDGLNSLTADYSILLEDTSNGAIVEMDANSEYTFTVDEATEVNNRFILHFGKAKVATDIDDEAPEADANIKVYVENSSKLVVNCEWNGDKQVYLFTIDGRMVLNDEFAGETFTKDLSLKPGIYVIKVIGDNDQYEQKVYVK